MKKKQSKILFITLLGLIILLSVIGCNKRAPEVEEISQLVVNLLDKENKLKTAEIKILKDGELVVSKKGRRVKFNLINGVYKVKVSSDQYASKSYDVYLTNDSKLDVRLVGKDNLLGNGGFEKKLSKEEPDSSGRVNTEDNWIFHLTSGGEGSVTVKDELAKVMVTDDGENDYSVQLIQAPVKIKKGGKYKVTFDAKAPGGKGIYLKIGANGDRGWRAYKEGKKKLTGNWKSYQFNFTMSEETDEKARFELWFLNSGGYWLDNIRLVKVGQREMPKEGAKTETVEDKVEDWELIWSEEFSGDEINEAFWNFKVGNSSKEGVEILGLGKGKLQYYTKDNAYIEDGKLLVKAEKEHVSNHHGSYDYTSAQMTTRHSFNIKYGRIEVRAKLPEGEGIWPSIWMLGDNIDEVGWPECGEIDIVKLMGYEPGTVYSAVHGPGTGSSGIVSGYDLPNGEKFSDEFHTFAVEWDENEVEFYVDDTLYHVVAKNEVIEEVGEKTWVYDHSYFLVLNVDIGGSWSGNLDENKVFPQTMEIDYIRFYKDKNPDSLEDWEEKWDCEYEEKWQKSRRSK